VPRTDTFCSPRFRPVGGGNKQLRKVTAMMFIALLVPIALLAVLLGMERLERWTVGERDEA